MTIVVEVDTAEGFLPMDGSGEFPIDPCELDIKEGHRIIFFFFNCEFDVLVTRVHVTQKLFDVTTALEHEKNIINIPSIVLWFELYGAVVQPYFFMMSKEEVG